MFVASKDIFCSGSGCSMTPLVTVTLSIGKETMGGLISIRAIYLLCHMIVSNLNNFLVAFRAGGGLP